MADDRLDIEFEQIVPWNGANDTGRDVRMKWQRNFERVRVSLLELESRIGEGAHVSDEDLQNILVQANTYTDAQVEAGIQLAVETAVEQSKKYTDTQVEAGVQLAVETAVEQSKQYTDTQVEAAVDLAIETAVEQANAYTDVQIEAVRSEIEILDEKFLRKDIPDTAQGHITFVQGLTAQSHSTFEEGVTVYGLAELMRLDVQELATIAQAVVQMMRSTRFVDGFAGEGYQIWQDIATGDWSMTLDRLTVRKVMAIYELIVQKIRSVGGMVVVSAANGKLKTVDRMGSMYVLEMEDDCQFQPHDLMRCQVFSSNGLKYYWVEVADVQSGRVYVPVSEFGGVEPAVGDEVVLMGNTTNTLRQNLILISATEDGQPRFDCLDGVNSKSFADCLKVRVGALDGISDSRFPADLQPQGYGLYGNNCYLTGVFVLSNGKDVQTMFSITEGLIKSEISSVRQEINEQDSYLSNASFTANLTGWQYGQDIRVFTVSNRLLMFNRNLYGRKDAFAGIVDEGTKNVLRIKDSYICQLNADLRMHPEFSTYQEVTVDEETGEEIVGDEYLKARMFYLSFRYRCTKPGTLRIYFRDESQGSFQAYEPLDYTRQLTPTDDFQLLEVAGKWNGTGDFYLSFDGDLYLYDLALSDNRLADVEERFTSRFELTDKRLEVAFEHIKETTTTVEEYRSEFQMTAEQLRISFSAQISSLDGRLDSAETSIEQNAKAITLKASQSSVNALGNRVTAAESSLTVMANQISLKVSQTDFDALGKRVTAAESNITQTAKEIALKATKTELDEVSKNLTTHTGSFHVSAAKIESMVSATNELGTTVSTIEQTAESIQTKVQGLEGNYSSLSQTATEIQASVNDIDGKYASLKVQVDAIGALVGDGTDGSFSEFQQTIDSLTTTVAETKTAADAAKQAATDAATAAANAQSTADSALAKAGTNATAIVQTQQSISALAGKFTFDADGNITNYSKSGLVLTSNFATLFSQQATADGLVKQADISTFITETEAGELISKASIRADQIDLTGKVTFSMFSSDLQGKVNGKVDSSSLGSLAYQSAVSAAMLDSTIIEGGFIKTSLINADMLVAKRLEAGTSEHTIRINDSGIYSYSYQGDLLFSLIPSYDRTGDGSYMEIYSYDEDGNVYKALLASTALIFTKNGSIKGRYTWT